MSARHLRMFLLMTMASVFQTSFFPALTFAGVLPDVVLVSAIAVAYRTGPETGALYGFGAGLFLDLFLSTPMGTSALAFAIMGFAVGTLQRSVLRQTMIVVPLLAGAGAFAGNLVHKVVGVTVGDEVFNLHAMKVIAIAVVYDVAIAPLVFLAASWATSETATVRDRL